MVKVDPTRDYYADLELLPNADVKDIKGQFRKLALKYHPDRNIGHEAEVNLKFQIIQSAHEILTDTELRKQYDAKRVRSRYPTASGVRGNPWQDVGSQFPPPPRRATRNTQSSSARFTNFTQNAPPTAKKPPMDEEAKRKNWEAFEKMRPSSFGRSQAETSAKAKADAKNAKKFGAEYQSVPRTPSQQQRAEASFGNRKSGYVPRTPFPGDDEPPVASKNYATSRHTSNLFTETAASARRRRDSTNVDPVNRVRESFLDSRQSTPYQTHGGEKLNPFEGASINRSRSTRDRTDASSPSDGSPGSRHRSSSLPRNHRGNNDPNLQVPTDAERPHSSQDTSPGASFASRARDKYTPSGPSNAASRNPSGNTTPSSGVGAKAGGDTTTYETPREFPTSPSHSSFRCKPLFKPRFKPRRGSESAKNGELSQEEHVEAFGKATPSGGRTLNGVLNAFDKSMQNMLEVIVGRASISPRVVKNMSAEAKRSSISKQPTKRTANANQSSSVSFTFSVNEDVPRKGKATASTFTRSSADDINTRFVDADDTDAWQFRAGGPDGQEDKRRSQSGSRLGRRSPLKRPTMRRASELGDQSTEAADAAAGSNFDAEGWSQKIGPQNFAPTPVQNASGSPNRGRREPRRKNSVRPTMGNAGMVSEGSSSDEAQWGGPPIVSEPVAADSPNAMDIDPPEPTQPLSASPRPNGARTIHVEPNRAEWRAGNVDGFKNGATKEVPPTRVFKPATMGSEDSDDFRASFGDLKNVAPFAPAASGLGSFGEMKSSLPFESKPSAAIPIEKEVKPEAGFPKPPMAPRPPTSLASGGTKLARTNKTSWAKYVIDFKRYIQLWDEFDWRITSHFAWRKKKLESMRINEGYDFLAAVGDDGCNDYMQMMHQDNEIREKWWIACREHEQRVREFMIYRAKMKTN